MLIVIPPTEAAMDANAPLLDDVAENSGPVDSDEEKDQVMAAIARSRPRPLAQHVFVPLQEKYQQQRIMEMLTNALGGGRGNIFGGGSGAMMSGGLGDGGEDSRRSSLAQPGSARGPGPGGLPTPTRKPTMVTPGVGAGTAA